MPVIPQARTLALALTTFGITLPHAHAQGLIRLSAQNGEQLDRFGEAVAVAGGLAAVGAPGRDRGNVTDAGAIYVFDIATGVELRVIEELSTGQFDNLGGVLAASGSTIAAGLPQESFFESFSGTVRLYDAKTGAPSGFFYAPDHAANDLFGKSVALRGRILAVGAPGDDDNGGYSGSAYVFDTVTGQLLHKLVASDGVSGDALGISVAIGDGNVIVGAESSDVGILAGAAYVFDLQTGAQIAKIQPPGNRPWDRFGSALATTGPLLVSGAPGDRPGNKGAVFVHDTEASTMVGMLVASDAHDYAYLGNAVAAHGNRIVVGSDHWGPAGRAYVYDATTGNEVLAFTPSTVDPQGGFGSSVAIGKRAFLVGAPYSHGGLGEVYLRRIAN